MNKLMHYINLRFGLSGCNVKEFECNKYSDCDSCLEAKIQEHDARAKADAIEELEKHIDGLKSIGRFNYESIKGVLEMLKEQKE